MSVTIIAILAAMAFVASLATGIWLMLHLNSVASVFEGHANLITSDSRPRYSKAQVVFSMAVLIGGAALCIVLALAAMAH